MKKQLNIKTLAKGMRVEDRAKLLFADRDKEAESKGKERLLSSEEEKALVEDAQNLHQIGELNRLNILYNIANYISLDIQTAYLHFKLAEGRLTSVLTGVVMVGEANDTLDQAIYDLATQGYTNKQLEKNATQKEIEKKATDLRKKYENKGLLDMYDYFEPSMRNSGYFTTNHKISGQPNPFLQSAVIDTISEVKKFNKQIYQWNYVVLQAGIELLSERQKKMITNFTKRVDSFVNLEGYLSLLKMYVSFANRELIRSEGLNEPKFLDSLKDMKRATKLSSKDEEKAEEEIEEIVHKHDS